MSENPYAAPTTDVSVGASGLGAFDAETIRKQYISHEASVKSIGTLYLLGAILVIPAGLYLSGGAIAGTFEGDDEVSSSFMLGLGIAYILLGIGQAATAIGLRRLRPWARTVASILSALGLLGFPIGTLISAYFLYLLLSKKGTYVFSEEYRRVIAETPHIKYRTSIFLIILLIILLLLMLAGIGAFLLGR